MENPCVKTRAAVELVKLLKCGIIVVLSTDVEKDIHEVLFWSAAAGDC